MVIESSHHDPNAEAKDQALGCLRDALSTLMTINPPALSMQPLQSPLHHPGQGCALTSRCMSGMSAHSVPPTPDTPPGSQQPPSRPQHQPQLQLQAQYNNNSLHHMNVLQATDSGSLATDAAAGAGAAGGGDNGTPPVPAPASLAANLAFNRPDTTRLAGTAATPSGAGSGAGEVCAAVGPCSGAAAGDQQRLSPAPAGTRKARRASNASYAVTPSGSSFMVRICDITDITDIPCLSACRAEKSCEKTPLLMAKQARCHSSPGLAPRPTRARMIV